ncbi:GNAT family N-acetyltransferase [Candidatus Gracilibacteria bacterium]|nr:GNAT family N-acetyltransferase [Candidatus Gracilibacteria bacterium]
MILIRQAAAPDAAAIAAFNAENDDVRGNVLFIAQQLTAVAAFEQIYVAEIDGAVVGMAGLRLLPTVCDPRPYAELTELYVSAAYRRRGIATTLLAHIEAVARLGGACELVLLTAWRNGGAHHFYHACGYTLYTVTMRKPLIDTP